MIRHRSRTLTVAHTAATVGALFFASFLVSACGPAPDDSRAPEGRQEGSYAYYPDERSMQEAATLVVRVNGPAQRTDTSLTASGHHVELHPGGRNATDDVPMPIYTVEVVSVQSDDRGTTHVGDRIRVAASVDTDATPPTSQERLLRSTGDVILYLVPSAQDDIWLTLSPYQGIEER